MRQILKTTTKHNRERGPVPLVLMALSLMITGCMPTFDTASTALVSESVTERVVMKIINNSCNDEKAEDPESLSTGSVKGLTKVLNGFGVPYDEHADAFSRNPQPVTDDSEGANKERGVGYMGIEAHYPQELAAGQSHSPDHPEQPVEPGGIFPNLTTEEEKYGIAMRWEYYNPDLSGAAVNGYLEFLKNNNGHKQYVAVHATNTDKWCICCPYDWGPALNLPTTGGGKYAGGRIGGVSAAAADELGFSGGDCPEAAMTECWWVENSDQVKCGPVSDLSQLTGGSSGKSGDDGSSTSKKATISTDITAKTLALATSSSKSSTSETSVEISPANPNSFVNKIKPEFSHGKLPKNQVKYIVMHDTDAGTNDASAIINAWAQQGTGVAPHFVINKQGKIFQCVEMGQVAWHAGDAGEGANEKFGLKPCDLNKSGKGEDGDNLMSWWSYGIALVHEHPDTEYPKAQMNALDRLVAYIDKYLGTEPKIIDHKSWANQDGKIRKKDCSDAFPLDSYQRSKNHSNVKTESDLEVLQASDECSDDEEDEDGDGESGGNGGEAIAKKAVEIAGSASPEPHIPGGDHQKPTDPRLAKYVSEKERVYPGDEWWAVCCRSAATAIKASGADEEFPLGAPSSMYDYCESSPKWSNVGSWRTGDSSGSLKPGDVLITKENHIKIWVGNEIAKTKFPSTNGNMYQGSANQYYPYISREEVSRDSRTYGIFRIKGSSGSKVDVSDWDSLYFSQSDPKWGDQLYQSSSIASSGCGLCATAHSLCILLGEEIDPPTLANKMKSYANSHGGINYGDGPGTAWYGWEEVIQGLYGDKINMERISTTNDAVRKAVDEGKMVIYNVPVGFSGIKLSNGGYRTTPGGHVMMVYKYDKGFCVKDSSGSRDGIPANCVVYDDADFARTMASSSSHLGWCYALSSKNGKPASKGKKGTKGKKSDSGSSGSSGKAKASRYVFVGDSRTCGLYEAVHADLNPDDNSILNGTAGKASDGTDEFWIGKVGMGYQWYKDTAIPILDRNVKSGDAVFVWLGINGVPAFQKEYAELTNQKAREWKSKGVSVYFVSIGPVDEGKAASWGYTESNSAIKTFNEGVKSGLSDAEWIDIYDKVNQGFGTYDGIHYDDDTSKKIYQMMIEGGASSGGAEGEEGEEEEEEEEEESYYVDVQRA